MKNFHPCNLRVLNISGRIQEILGLYQEIWSCPPYPNISTASRSLVSSLTFHSCSSCFPLRSCSTWGRKKLILILQLLHLQARSARCSFLCIWRLRKYWEVSIVWEIIFVVVFMSSNLSPTGETFGTQVEIWGVGINKKWSYVCISGWQLLPVQ